MTYLIDAVFNAALIATFLLVFLAIAAGALTALVFLAIVLLQRKPAPKPVFIPVAVPEQQAQHSGFSFGGHN